ncbi:MAG: TIGR01777 family protein [Salinivirgaceae bacterium]|nr:MAG: TIGR01777 family protein [Salinivirgaceae bacterium]
MNIFVFGGTGMIGKAFCEYAMLNGHKPIIVSRFPEKHNLPYQICGYPDASSTNVQRLMKGGYAAVNLSGANIAEEKWTDARKDQLEKSRIDIIDRVELFIQQAPQEPDVILQASAIGYYGDTGDKEIKESDEPGKGFLAELAVKWEARFKKIELEDTRKIMLRTGVVLSNAGGMLPRISKPFKMFMGGVVGSGKQYVSWIHMQDMVRAMLHLIEDDFANGAFNLTSPNPVTMKEFSKKLGKTLKRPSSFPIPNFIIKMLYGEMGKETMLSGTRVIPSRLNEYEFEFIYTDLELAFKNLLIKRKGKD